MGFPQFWIGIRKLDVKIVEKILNIVIAYIVRTVKLVKDAYPVFTGKMINLVKSLISFARQIDPRSLHVALVNVEPPRETQGPEVVASKQTHERDVSRILPEIQHDKVILSKRAKKKNKQQKAEGNQNEPPEQVETVETKSETVRPEKNRSKNRKGPAKKPKDQPRKEFEKVEVVLDVKRVTTLVRFSSEQHESEIRNPCPLCCTSFKESALERHLGHVHGTRCSLVPLLCSDIRNHVISREIFQLKLEQKSNRNGSTFVFKITNCAAVTLLLKSIYTSDGNGSLSSIFAGPGVLRMKPGFYYEDEIEVQVSDDCVQSLLVTVNPIEDVRLPYDVVEQYHIKKVSAKRTRINGFQWINIGIASNEEQMVAVRNIVNRTSFPAPYVLFGPPGTGKSSTLVEAIGQIYLHRPQANMLVVAPSNFAANEITSRILNVIPEKHVFRYFSMRCRRNVDNIDEQILQVSNMADKEFELPFYEDIYLARIVVATLATSGRLVQAKIKEKHFSYVIVDECGSAKEITSLVAIGGLATCHDEIHASIVLAGDPKQLGPVIRNDYLKETNQSVSLLERIMTLNLYEMNHNTKGYNNRYITQLRDNFRSHQNLLNFPNNAFYAGQLRAKASPELTHWALKWPRLPNPNCPLIFHSIVGKTQRDNSSFSLFNREEAELVLDYLGDILSNDINGRQVGQCDIGVISPYAAQVLHLRMLCKDRGWQEIEIGSAEQYQGREKAVIILSTVRSRCSNVGFLSDARRLNVTITRARALLVVVGNHNTLQLDDNWKAFIRYCQGSKAFIDGGTTILTKKNEELKKREQRTKPNPAEKMGGSSSQKAKIRNAQMKGSSAQRKPYVPTSNSNSNNKSTKSNSALENHKQSGKVDLEKCDKNSKKLKSIPRPEDTKKATKTSGGKQVVNVNTKKQQGSTHAQTNNKPTKQTLPTAKGKTIYNRRKSKQTKREKSTNKAKQDVQTTDGNQQVDEAVRKCNIPQNRSEEFKDGGSSGQRNATRETLNHRTKTRKLKRGNMDVNSGRQLETIVVEENMALRPHLSIDMISIEKRHR
ncbi:uncharacterized protein LOC109403351 isoform X2 [Aedes albopictus]|uniref:AAA+ ATPase domain-containing protein n=1 Tax=Aedes albopictus TaxID=7160 RepID=A0ABM1YUX6_AEDAL